jgi:hypothetical protein
MVRGKAITGGLESILLAAGMLIVSASGQTNMVLSKF